MSNYLKGPIQINPKSNPYNRVVWEDDLVDPNTHEVLEEGTTFWADYGNNLEWGIWNAFEYMVFMYRQLERLRAQMEIDGRVPGNSGAFFDTFDGTPSRLTLLTTSTDALEDVTTGATTIPVASTEGFDAFTYVTIYDGQNMEHVQIAAIGEGELTVNALANGYAKGAKIARSSAGIDTATQGMSVAPHVQYDVELVEVV